MSQIIRATFVSPGLHGISWNVSGSGIATMSDSSIALKPVIDRVLDLARRHCKRLEMALDVGEPQEDELDALVPDPLHDVATGLLARRCPVPALDLRHGNLLLKTRKPQTPWSA
jgi:hypothetical protein